MNTEVIPLVNRQQRVTVLLVLGTAIAMAGAFTVLFAATFGLFLKPMNATFGWTRGQVAMLPTAAFIGYALGAPAMGWLTDQIGPRAVVLLGTFGVALGLAGMALLPGLLPDFLAICFLFGFLGAGTAPTGYMLILTRRLRQRLGLGIAFAMLGLGAGMIAMPILAQMLIHRWGWRGAYLAFAPLSLLLGAIGLLLGTGNPARGEPTAPRHIVGPLAITGENLAGAALSWRFWLLCIATFAIGAADFGGITHLVASLSDRGIADMAAGHAAAIAGAGVLLGRVGAALLLDRLFVPLVAMGCCGLGGLGLMLIALLPADQIGLLYLAAFLCGLPVGCEGDTIPFIIRRYFGLAFFGSIYGWVVGLAAFGAAVGPLAFGLCYDATGSYALMFGLAGVTCLLSGLTFLTLGPYRYALHG